jgi:glutamate/tyrosine decarboxylase-like PLP-dependent enzyme
MEQLRDGDVRWRDGKAWSLVFHAGEELSQFLKQPYTMFFSENGLNPAAFPSLGRFEVDVVSMVGGLLGGDQRVVGNMTSGGTESIMLAVKTAREWGRKHKPLVRQPEMVLPLSAHPAFHTAAHYFGLRAVQTEVGKDFRADARAVRRAVTRRTVLLVGSAVSYPQGVVDPRERMLEQGKLVLLNAALRVLPSWVVSRGTRLASVMLGLDGGDLPQRTAPMYGLMGALPNRGDLQTMVIDLLDRMTRPDVR